MRWLGLVASLGILSLWTSLLEAHAFSRSVSNWQIEDQGRVGLVFSTPRIAAESVPYGDRQASPEQRLIGHLKKTIKLSKGDQLCKLVSAQSRKARDGRLKVAIRFHCPQFPNAALQVEISSFFDSDPSHIHFARFFFKSQSKEHLFSNRNRFYALSDKESQTSSNRLTVFLDYVPMGMDHILIGLDHLAFLAALLLVCGLTGAIFWAVTGFTLGHSLTLGLASAGVLGANLKMIEALIGFTIMVMALEYAGFMLGAFRKIFITVAASLAICLGLSLFFPTSLTLFAWAGLLIFTFFWGLYLRDMDHGRQLAPFLSVAFGLIHGFGFAAVLFEIGLPQEHFLAALFGFNIGVELGQLAFVFFALLAVFTLSRLWKQDFIWREASYILASVLVGLGVYWFIERSFF